jgi:hypothetical protein
VIIDTANLPFQQDDNHSSLDKKFPMYISKVIEFYEQGGRYKEFRNILKKQKRKEAKKQGEVKPGYTLAKQCDKPQVLSSELKNGHYVIHFL